MRGNKKENAVKKTRTKGKEKESAQKNYTGRGEVKKKDAATEEKRHRMAKKTPQGQWVGREKSNLGGRNETQTISLLLHLISNVA